MIDFLGRRMLCARLPGEADRRSRDRAEWQRLGCAGLGEEERTLRTLHASDHGVLAWLNEDPERFENPMLRTNLYDGPALGRAMQVSQRGSDKEGRGRYEVSATVEDGRVVFNIAVDRQPPVRFIADLAALPELDLQTLEVNYETRHPLIFGIAVRYGYRQGYCGYLDQDDRPTLNLWIERGAPRAYRTGYVNCEPRYLDVPNLGDTR
jgi:hypothetical protein